MKTKIFMIAIYMIEVLAYGPSTDDYDVDHDCWSYGTTELVSNELEIESEKDSYNLWDNEWYKSTMYLMPGAYCSYSTIHDTKVVYDENKVTAKYYKYEGNNIPWLHMCRLT